LKNVGELVGSTITNDINILNVITTVNYNKHNSSGVLQISFSKAEFYKVIKKSSFLDLVTFESFLKHNHITHLFNNNVTFSDSLINPKKNLMKYLLPALYLKKFLWFLTKPINYDISELHEVSFEEFMESYPNNFMTRYKSCSVTNQEGYNSKLIPQLVYLYRQSSK
jgi:hypothetical protein